jgi:5-methylcytosine-specific restriction endonuclease McrA
MPNESEKAHCKRMAEVIRATASGFYKMSNKSFAIKTFYQKKAIPVQSKPQPTEQSVRAFIDNHSKVDPASDDFLSTFEWKAVRMMALKKYGPVCQCCGATPSTGAVMHVDHIKPRKIFPQLALDVENLQVLCGDCNQGKGNWDMTDWRKESISS